MSDTQTSAPCVKTTLPKPKIPLCLQSLFVQCTQLKTFDMADLHGDATDGHQWEKEALYTAAFGTRVVCMGDYFYVPVTLLHQSRTHTQPWLRP